MRVNPNGSGKFTPNKRALEQPCTLRGRLGLRRRVPVWRGADAAPDHAIGPFADANLVSIPGRCGS